MRNHNLIPYFPFLESIFEELKTRLSLENNINFPGVETKHPFLPGYYDYVFTLKKAEEKEIIQWQIVDATDTYKQLKVQQQSSHEQSAFPHNKIKTASK